VNVKSENNLFFSVFTVCFVMVTSTSTVGYGLNTLKQVAFTLTCEPLGIAQPQQNNTTTKKPFIASLPLYYIYRPKSMADLSKKGNNLLKKTLQQMKIKKGPPFFCASKSHLI
jgi:hypothetical protein